MGLGSTQELYLPCGLANKYIICPHLHVLSMLMTLGLKLELDVYIIDEGARWEGAALSRTI